MPPLTDEDRRTEFEYYLGEALDGRSHWDSCTGLSTEVFAALAVVAREYPETSDRSVMAAHRQLEQDLDRTPSLELLAVRRAFDAGLISAREPDYPDAVTIPQRYEYRGEYITIGFADPGAAEAWLMKNRVTPSPIYQHYVLDPDGWKTPYKEPVDHPSVT